MGGKRSGRHPKVDWSRADWSRLNREIAAELGVTEAAVWFARRRHAPGTRPGARAETPVRRFAAYLEAHRDELHGLDAMEIRRRSGTGVGRQSAQRMVRAAGIRTSRAPWSDGADWRLPDADLAEIWGVAVQAVTAQRLHRLAPQTRWRRNSPADRADPQYLAALEAERERGKRPVSQ